MNRFAVIRNVVLGCLISGAWVHASDKALLQNQLVQSQGNELLAHGAQLLSHGAEFLSQIRESIVPEEPASDCSSDTELDRGSEFECSSDDEPVFSNWAEPVGDEEQMDLSYWLPFEDGKTFAKLVIDASTPLAANKCRVLNAQHWSQADEVRFLRFLNVTHRDPEHWGTLLHDAVSDRGLVDPNTASSISYLLVANRPADDCYCFAVEAENKIARVQHTSDHQRDFINAKDSLGKTALEIALEQGIAMSSSLSEIEKGTMERSIQALLMAKDQIDFSAEIIALCEQYRDDSCMQKIVAYVEKARSASTVLEIQEQETACDIAESASAVLEITQGEAEKVLEDPSWWRSVWRMAGISGVVLAISALAYYFHEYGELPSWTATMQASLHEWTERLVAATARAS